MFWLTLYVSLKVVEAHGLPPGGGFLIETLLWQFSDNQPLVKGRFAAQHRHAWTCTQLTTVAACSTIGLWGVSLRRSCSAPISCGALSDGVLPWYVCVQSFGFLFLTLFLVTKEAPGQSPIFLVILYSNIITMANNLQQLIVHNFYLISWKCLSIFGSFDNYSLLTKIGSVVHFTGIFTAIISWIFLLFLDGIVPSTS